MCEAHEYKNGSPAEFHLIVENLVHFGKPYVHGLETMTLCFAFMVWNNELLESVIVLK
jgi:hypothetical protein